METFKWKVKPDMKKQFDPRVKSVKFGDGYEQRRSDGINNNLKKYNVTLNYINSESLQIESFLEKHAGVTAFLWKPPHQPELIQVLCRKWSSSVGMIRTEITAEFEQVLL
ncbi:phage tail protein [Proteus mirabilis]|nr:phage tail protein [Proteus mirabilis]